MFDVKFILQNTLFSLLASQHLLFLHLYLQWKYEDTNKSPLTGLGRRRLQQCGATCGPGRHWRRPHSWGEPRGGERRYWRVWREGDSPRPPSHWPPPPAPPCSRPSPPPTAGCSRTRTGWRSSPLPGWSRTWSSTMFSTVPAARRSKQNDATAAYLRDAFQAVVTSFRRILMFLEFTPPSPQWAIFCMKSLILQVILTTFSSWHLGRSKELLSIADIADRKIILFEVSGILRAVHKN